MSFYLFTFFCLQIIILLQYLIQLFCIYFYYWTHGIPCHFYLQSETDKREAVALADGTVISVAEYKKLREEEQLKSQALQDRLVEVFNLILPANLQLLYLYNF